MTSEREQDPQAQPRAEAPDVDSTVERQQEQVQRLAPPVPRTGAAAATTPLPPLPAAPAQAEPSASVAPAAPAAPVTPTAPVSPATHSSAAQAPAAPTAPIAPAFSQGSTPQTQPGFSPQTTPAAAGSSSAQPSTPLGALQGSEPPVDPAAVPENTVVSSDESGGGAVPPNGLGVPVSDGPDHQRSGSSKRVTGLLAGLAIGALLGGAMGGGVAAIVASNASSKSVTQSTSSGTVTMNNPKTATQITGVASIATPSVVTLEVTASSTAGSGSGVIYSEDGYILTNAHVVTLDGAANDADISVKLSDGRIYSGTLVGTDPYADLAVVKIDAEDLTPIEIADSSALNVGDLTVAIGAPLDLANTVTSGVISALNRGISVGSTLIPDDSGDDDQSDRGEGGEGNSPWDFEFGAPGEESQEQQQQQTSSSGTVTLPVIQTDASINPGNSGGALLNGSGELIGINVAIASNSSSSETAGSDGLGFAIPSNLAARVADSIIAGETPSHGLLGASVADSTEDTDADVNYSGGLIMEVTDGGAADKAGLKAGDVITAVDGIPTADGTSVSAQVRMHEGGSEVAISIRRDGEAKEVTATLGTLE